MKKTKKLISLSASKIEGMSKKKLLITMAKAEYETVFTAATWENLNAKLLTF